MIFPNMISGKSKGIYWLMSIERFEDTHPTIATTAYIADSAVIIGDVEIGEDSSVWPMAVIRGDIQRIRIGARTNIQDGTIIHVTHAGRFNPDGQSTIIDDDVIIGHRVVLHGCTIRRHSLVGMGAIIMDGVIINSDIIIGAGSVVPPHKELDGGYLWLGNPVKKIRELKSEEKEFIRYSVHYYVELKNRYLIQLG